MRLHEIIINPARDEYLANYANYFNEASTVATIRNLTLKKAQTNSDIHYGLFDSTEDLVGYFSLYKPVDLKNDIWCVALSQLEKKYKGQGYGAFLYDYAIMHDKVKILSGDTNTSGPFGSKELWLRLRTNNRYAVVGYDTETNEIIPNATPEMIFNNKENARWLALPPGETINETLV